MRASVLGFSALCTVSYAQKEVEPLCILLETSLRMKMSKVQHKAAATYMTMVVEDKIRPEGYRHVFGASWEPRDITQRRLPDKRGRPMQQQYSQVFRRSRELENITR